MRNCLAIAVAGLAAEADDGLADLAVGLFSCLRGGRGVEMCQLIKLETIYGWLFWGGPKPCTITDEKHIVVGCSTGLCLGGIDGSGGTTLGCAGLGGGRGVEIGQLHQDGNSICVVAPPGSM